MHSQYRLSVAVVTASVVAVFLTSAAGAAVMVGAMGDSYSDEYSALTPGLYNWVDLLVQSGRADFGPFATFPSGDPRNTGGSTGSYTYNYAKGGATTTSALGSTQLIPFVQNYHSQPGSPNRPDLWPGIRGAGTSGAIKYASQDIGGNDMLGLISSNKLIFGLDTGSMNPIVNNFQSITNIATANYTSPLKMVLVQYPDLGSMPLLGAYPQFAKDSVRLNVTYFNNSVALQALQHGSTTVDLFSLWDNIRNAGGTTIHGIYISPGTSTGGLQDLRSAWLSDGLHPTPIFNALWTNLFITALDTAYGESIPLLTPKEMVTLTGVDPQQSPIATAGSAYNATVGHALTLSAAGSTDPNPGDVPYLTYSWDINGVANAAVGANPTLSWAQLSALGIGHSGSYQVDVRVDDTFGGVTTSVPVNLQVTLLSGDANFDGIVNGQDISLAAGHWLETGADIPGDVNGDGIVNGQDMTLMAGHWLDGSGGGGAAAAVPEPSSWVLAAVGAFALLRRRRCLRMPRAGAMPAA